MLETVKSQFPHLSETDCINIAIFTIEYGKQERKEVWDTINARIDKQLADINNK